MPPLPQKQLQQLEQRLRKRREDLRQIIHAELADSSREDFTELAGMVHDAGDESFAELLRGMLLTTRARELDEIRDVEAALQRIKNGIYDRCADCDAEITYDRFDAYPTAMRCIACQNRHENRRGGRDVTPGL